MPVFHSRTFTQCCNALAGLSLILSSIVACDDQRPPPPTDDPGSVARNVVADFLSVPPTDATVVSLKAHDFNDSSLDCPQSGMTYQQVITPGHRAIVEADGRRFDVRIAGSYGRICRNKNPGKPKRTPARDSAITSMIDSARQNLAGLLDVEAPNIRMIDVHPYTGNNRPVGCTPQCSESDEPCGYIIGFFYDGRRYDFHADDGNAIACPPILRM